MAKKLAANVYAKVDGSFVLLEKGSTPPSGVDLPSYAFEGDPTEDLIGAGPGVTAKPEPDAKKESTKATADKQ